MTYEEYELIVEKLNEKLDNGLITESTAEAINSYCYDKYMESYVDGMLDNLDDEYNESTRLSREIYYDKEDQLKELNDEKRKVNEQITAYEKLYNTAGGPRNSKKTISVRLERLRERYKQLEEVIDDVKNARIRAMRDTKYFGGHEFKGKREYGINAKNRIRRDYDTKPAEPPREPGLYKKLQDNKIS